MTGTGDAQNQENKSEQKNTKNIDIKRAASRLILRQNPFSWSVLIGQIDILHSQMWICQKTTLTYMYPLYLNPTPGQLWQTLVPIH